jgi:hypothetical protein
MTTALTFSNQLASVLILVVSSFTTVAFASDAHNDIPELEVTDLGVRVLRPVYAIVPLTRDGHTNVTVVMTIWLKRVGSAKGPWDMQHQAKVRLH